MRIRTALFAAALLAASPLLAQTPSTGAPPRAPAHQPGVPAQPASSSTPAQKAAPATEATADKPDAAKDAAIRQLLDITETSKMGDSINQYVTNQVHQALSQAMPPEQLTKLMSSFSQKMAVEAPASAVTDASVAVYARSFSMEDIQALIQFYQSPLGQRVVKALPQAARESQDLGVQMQEKGAMTVLQGMSNEYPELKQMLRAPDAGPDAGPAPERAPAPKSVPATPKN
jgi:hypothetical protein